MEKTSRIFVAGHRGLVGSAIVRALQAQGFDQILTRARGELDLRDARQVDAYFAGHRPEYVFLAAAKAGGILANNTYPADFIRDNLQLQTSVIDACQRFGVTRLLFLGSSSIYPRLCPQPMQEEHLLTGELEPTNRPYALAKIAGIELCWACNRQYGTQFFCALPTNLYGPGDHYDAQNAHVLPALLRKAVEAKALGRSEIVVWGSGRPRRELLFNQDLADACVFLMQLSGEAYQAAFPASAPPIINIGQGEDHSILELAQLVCRVVGFDGDVRLDPSYPDGTPRKLLDSSRIRALGWQPKTRLEDGIRLALSAAQEQLLALIPR